MDSAVTGSRLLTIDVDARVRPLTPRRLLCSRSQPMPIGVSSTFRRHARARRRIPCASRAWLALVALRAGPASAPPRRRSGRCSTQADFLKGDVEDLSIDSDGRMFLGPSASLVAETAAPFLWTVVAGADGTLVGRQRQRRQGPQGRQGRQGHDVLRCHRARSARDRRRRRTAGSTSRRRPTARSIRSRADGTSKTFFDPEDKYIWALAVDRVRQRVRRDRRQGRHLQDHAGRQGHALLQDERRPTSSRSRSRRPATSSPAPNRPDACSGSTPRARRSSCSIRRSARSTRCASPTTGRSTRRP